MRCESCKDELRAVFALQRRRARRQGLRGGQGGAVSFIQFFGSALQVTPHFHSPVPDGVFVPREGGVRFVPVARPTGFRHPGGACSGAVVSCRSMRDPERWTALHFVRAASEFEQMTSDHATWTEEQLKENPPRLVRLRRLRALAKAFDVQPGFEALWSAEFVQQRPFEHYQPFVQRVMQESETQFPDALRSMRRPLITWDVEHVYERLFRFLTRHAYPMLAFNDGVLEASGVYLYTVLRVQHSLAGLPELIRPIEELAGLVIDPASRSFSHEELAAYGWPPEDLFSIDLDYV